MAASDKLRPEFVAFISGITKYIDATDHEKAEENKKERDHDEARK